MPALQFRTGSVVVLLSLTAIACNGAGTASGASALAPQGSNHRSHLVGGSFAPGVTCAGCHAPTGFVVDFSQNPSDHQAGATFDPTSKTCSNVSCHGNFTLGAVTGTHAIPAWPDATPLTCASCHGMPPTGHPNVGGKNDAASCAGCHSDTVNPDGSINIAFGAHMNGLSNVTGGTCSTCHGDPARLPSSASVDPLLTSAPPISPKGAPAYADGAHLIHLNPNPSVAASHPTACSECHVVPTDSLHATVPPAQKVFFGAMATANGAAPTFNPVTAGCSATYCHGNFSFGKVTGSTATPVWSDTTRIACGSCHDMPPAGHPPVTGPSPAPASSCNACHPQTIDAAGLVIQAGFHMNGRADVGALGCTGCHGDKTRVGTLPGADLNLASSPPVATTQASPSVVGAHLGHLNPAAATALMGPMACSECHVVPTDFAHATAPPAQRVVFGSLAKAGGVVPTYTPGTLGCAASYCHGNFDFSGVAGSKAAPVWTDTAALTCTSCHDMPPAGHPPIAASTAVSCSGCHPKSVNPDGSINLTDKGHLNGLPDTSALGCSTCHGNAGRTGNLPGTDANLVSSPPVAPPGAPSYATGVHDGHVNPTVTSFLMAPIACAECHVVPADSAHARNPPARKVVFGPISTGGGAIPTWTSTTTGCAATYCHGNFTFNGVSGAKATPLWTDTAAMTCTSCHGMPPTGHFTTGTTASACAVCHPDAVNANGTINQAAKGHLNGKPDVNNMACNSCHGDATRKPNLTGTDANLTSAPPVAQPGAPAFAVGTHQGHLNPTTASYMMAPIACAECHVVPTDTVHATVKPAAVVVFGTLSRTGGAAPAFSATTTGCSATYCHGNFTLGAVKGSNATPLWTDTTPLTCTSCHGMLPTGHPAYAGAITAASCFQCHPQSVNSNGTIKQGGGHINGKADGGGCTACHGDPPTTGKHTNSDHRNLRCDKCHPTGFTSAVTVAPFHNNGNADLGSQAGYRCNNVASLLGCPAGQTRTCANSCHGSEKW
jgi:predicted CxxxxCH...CXXCH cytochrome family protein